MQTAFAALLLAAGVTCLPELTISKQRPSGASGLVHRDDGTLDTTIFNILAYSGGGAYYINVTVGTPPQSQVLILDTGSSDLYFDASSAETCQGKGLHTCRGGSFTPKDSSTYKEIIPSPAFNTSFGDGSTALGPFGKDTIGIADILIEDVQFGVAEETDTTTSFAVGLMGLGYSLLEATDTQYPNLPEILVSSGVIASRLYSVFLNELDDLSGTILFGGIDTSKYTGDLVTVDILPTPNTPEVIYEFITTITGMKIHADGSDNEVFSGGTPGQDAYDDESSLPVLLDTGSAAWLMPSDVFSGIASDYFSFVDYQGTCSCEWRKSDLSIELEFAGKIKITVPASQFIAPVYQPVTNTPYTYMNGTERCLFMIQGDRSDVIDQIGFGILGDAFLRSMYVVFDLDNGQMSLAQAAKEDTAKPNIVTIGAGPSAIASAISSGYSGASSNAVSIGSPASNTMDYSVATAASTIGTATGSAAVPTDARIASGSGDGASLPSSTTSTEYGIPSESGGAQSTGNTGSGDDDDPSDESKASVVLTHGLWQTSFMGVLVAAAFV